MTSHKTSVSGNDLPVVRRSAIVKRLTEAGTVKTQELVDGLGVSVETIRRDLAALEEEGVLERVHGGATLVAFDQRIAAEPPYADRTLSGESEKQRIGQAAARLIREDSTLFLDVGTTALCVAQALPSDFRGIVATNSLPAAAEVAQRTQATVLVSGGQLSRANLAMAGQQALSLLEEVRADLAFLGSGGVHPSGLTDFYLDEVATRRAMIRNSAQAYVLADAGKFNRIAPFRVAGWEDLAGLITDQDPPAGLSAGVHQAGGELIVATP